MSVGDTWRPSFLFKRYDEYELNGNQVKRNIRGFCKTQEVDIESADSTALQKKNKGGSDGRGSVSVYTSDEDETSSEDGKVFLQAGTGSSSSSSSNNSMGSQRINRRKTVVASALERYKL